MNTKQSIRIMCIQIAKEVCKVDGPEAILEYAKQLEAYITKQGHNEQPISQEDTQNHEERGVKVLQLGQFSAPTQQALILLTDNHKKENSNLQQ